MITQNIIKEVRKRNKLYKKHRKHPNNELKKIRYIEQKQSTLALIKMTKKQYFRRKFIENKNDSRKTWEFINKQIHPNKNVNTIKEITKNDGINSTKIIANELNNYFTTVGQMLAEEQILKSKGIPKTTTTKKT